MTSPHLNFLLVISWLTLTVGLKGEDPIVLEGLDLDIILDGSPFDGEKPSNETMRPLKLATEDARREMLSYMKGQIADLETACNLSSQQKRRLTTAAKGAIDSSMEQWVRKIESWGWIERSGRLDRDTARRFLTNVGASESAVIRNKIWIDAVESTLSPSQQAQRSSVLSQRAISKRKNAVQMAANRLGEELDLNPDQLKLVTQLMDEKIGRRLARQENPPESVIAFARFLPLDDLKTILNEDQFQQWEQFLEHAPENEPVGF
tara:strand:- start:4368 stop:5156 length:789 start_codon:yes stop_codon:yes gene_type:complete